MGDNLVGVILIATYADTIHEIPSVTASLRLEREIAGCLGGSSSDLDAIYEGHDSVIVLH